MSTAASTLTSTQQRDQDLNHRILAGDILGAFEEFYADDVVMQENTTDPFVGKDLNRDREKAFVDSLAEVHSVQLLGSAVNGDRTYSEWVLDVTFKNGTRYTLTQVAVRQWKGGKVAHERFYYKG
jgi:ketosteroid isomerase-like protein